MKPNDFTIVHALDQTKWCRFLSAHQHANIFLTPESFQIFTHTKNHCPEIWCCLSRDGEILVLFMPVIIRFPCLTLDPFSRAVAYGGILIHESKLSYLALKHLLSQYRKKYKNKILFTEIRNLSDTSEYREIFSQAGFVYHDYLNYVIDLRKSPDAIFRQFGKNVQKQIRRASQKGQIEIREITRLEELRTAYDLLRMTYRYKHIPLADFSLFEQAFRVLWPQKRIQILLAFDQETPVATSFELFYHKTIYGWYAGTDRQKNRHYANELLMWEILKRGAESGYHFYDFGGAGYPHEPYGVRDFKAKFGGNLVNYGRYCVIHSPHFYPFFRFLYQLYRRLSHQFSFDF